MTISMLFSKQRIVQFVLIGSCGALLAAWAAEFVFGLPACILCLYQRYLYLTAIALLSMGAFAFEGRYLNYFLALVSLSLFACAVTAAYQVAVENSWVSLPNVCKEPEMPDSFEEMKQMITSKAHVACHEVVWSLFGLSIATYNAIYALILSMASFAGIFRNDRVKKKFARR